MHHITGSNSTRKFRPNECAVQCMTIFISHIPIPNTVLQQMNHPSSEQFALIHSLSDTALRAAANVAYLKLEKENWALRDRVDNLQCVYINLTRIYDL